VTGIDAAVCIGCDQRVAPVRVAKTAVGANGYTQVKEAGQKLRQGFGDYISPGRQFAGGYQTAATIGTSVGSLKSWPVSSYTNGHSRKSSGSLAEVCQ